MRPLIVASVALAVLPVSIALAQDAPPKARTIEEIIITAQKREQSIQDVPISVTVLDSAFIADQAITRSRKARG